MRELFPVKLWLYLQMNESVYGGNISLQKRNLGFNKFVFVRKKLTCLNAGSRRSYIALHSSFSLVQQNVTTTWYGDRNVVSL